MRNHITRHNAFKEDNDRVVLTIGEFWRLQLQLPVLQWMPSVDEEGRNRSYAFKNIDEIVLTIEEHSTVAMQVLASQWLVSCEKKC